MNGINEQDPSERFAFGKNWKNFLKHLDETRIEEAMQDLQVKLGFADLKERTFIDAGSGSGLFSLAAHRLGAKVISFDYDEDSVQCTRALKEKYAAKSEDWTVLQGSVLDTAFLETLGQADIVYCWGVLHHTGKMFEGLANISRLVKPQGLLFISIYNDQGIGSKMWYQIKKTYVRYPISRPWLILFCGLWIWKYRIALGTIRYGNPYKFIREYNHNNRGMSAYYDLIDWVGGYPFEVASPEKIFDYLKARNYELLKLKTCAGKIGCNEYIFSRK